MQIYEDTMAFDLLKTLGLCGDYYFKSLYLIPGDHDWMLRVSRELEKERYISRSGVGQLRKLRLMQRGIDLLTDIDEPVARQYRVMFEENNPAGDKRHVWRKLRLSETMQMMRRADVKVACYEKPVLIPLDEGDEPVNKRLEASYLSKSIFYSKEARELPMFYSSLEMKECDLKEKSKTSYTRMIGALVASDEVYGVYNMGTERRYNPSSENSIRVLLSNIVRKNGWRTREVIDSNTAKSILLGRDIETAKTLLTADVGENVHSFQLDVNFKTANFVPMNEEGIRLLRIITQPGFNEKIRDDLLPDNINAKDMDLTVDADGWDSEKSIYYYLFFDSDLMRLGRVKNGLVGKTCRVVCFPWQKDIVNEAIPGADIATLETAAIEDIFQIGSSGKQ